MIRLLEEAHSKRGKGEDDEFRDRRLGDAKLGESKVNPCPVVPSGAVGGAADALQRSVSIGVKA